MLSYIVYFSRQAWHALTPSTHTHRPRSTPANQDLFVCLARTTSRSNLRPTVLSPQALLYRSHCGRLSQAGSCFNTKTFFGHSSTTLLSLYPSRNLFKTWRSATHDVHALFQLKRLPYLASNLDDSPAIQATHGCPLEGFPPLTNPTIFIVVNSLRSEVTHLHDTCRKAGCPLGAAYSFSG